jgi:C4-dicarboxylate transporter DctQ subunit
MNKLLNHIEEWLISFLIAGATALIFLAVVHRYLSSLPIPGVQDWMLSLNFSWAQELCIIMFVWMAKFGAAYGVRTGIHVGVDVLINRMSEKNHNRFVIFGLLAGAFFTGSIGILGARFVWDNGAHFAFLNLFGMPLGDVFEGPTTPDLEWPTWMVYSAIPLGSSLMCYRFLQVAVSFWKTGELPHHDHAHVEGVEDEPPLIAEAVEMVEERLHAHMGRSDKAWEKTHPHHPQNNKES